MNVPPSLFWRTSLESISFSYQSFIFLCCYALTCEANPASIFEALCAEFICDVLIGWSCQVTASLEPSTFANWPQDHASMAHHAWDSSGPPKCLIAAYTLMNGFQRKVTALPNKLHTLHQTQKAFAASMKQRGGCKLGMQTTCTWEHCRSGITNIL